MTKALVAAVLLAGVFSHADDTVPVMAGRPAAVTTVKIVAAEDEGSGKPPYQSVLVATVSYNAMCDVPLSFVAVKPSNLVYEIYETRNQGPPSTIPCQGIYMITKKIYLAHYLDIHPNSSLIKVNGVGVSN